MSQYRFVNPYNFIPLSGKRSEAEGGERTYTGVISYSVLTKTPLFIPNTSSANVFPAEEKEHKSYDFFTYMDLSGKTGPSEGALPVIPGSEMRGMLRSNYEILTNSCLSSVDDDVTLSKRTNEVFRAGLMRRKQDGSFDLYEAEDCLVRTMGKNCLKDDWREDREHFSRQCYIQDEIPEGTKVYFHKEKRLSKNGRPIKSLAKRISVSDNRGRESVGYMIKGEAGPDMKGRKHQKHCCHIFVLKAPKQNRRGGKKQDWPKTDISLKTLDLVLREYKNNEEHPYTEYAKWYAAFKRGEGEEYFPVYYSFALEDHLMLSPACITREIYRTKLKALLGSYRTCEDKDHLCPACSLFGAIGKSFSVASRVRFSDLTCRSLSAKDCFMEKVTLAPLSSPKLNNMEFYLQRPSKDAVFWTYDYYIDKNGTVHPNTGCINGRKFYWHNLNPDMKCCKAGTQNMTVRPVRKGIFFDGKLYFQNLSKEELDQIIFLLNTGEEGDISGKGHGYKLGGAKPLGLGSVAMSVNSVLLRRIVKDEAARTVERKEIAYEAYTEPNFDSEIMNNFMTMTDFNAVKGMEVRYPRTDKVDEDGNPVIFDWFVKNHVRKKGDGSYDNGMPNTRSEMAYAEYLEAMVPETRHTKTRSRGGNIEPE